MRDLRPGQRELMQEAYGDFGIKRGTTIPLLPHLTFQGFFTMIDQVSIHSDVLHIFSIVANTCTNKIMEKKTSDILICLTEREKQILWEKSQGLTVRSISFKLNISISTTAFHLANIRRKLRVKTTEHAVSKFLIYSPLLREAC